MWTESGYDPSLVNAEGVCAAQGHFQIMFSKYCPLAQRKLSLFMKIMYCSGVWSYIVGALTAPLYIIIPLLTIWAGMFPIVVSWWAAGEGTAPRLPLSRHSMPICLY